MDMPTNYKPLLCKLDDDDCVSLINIIKSFNTPVSEEHAWALCYQCAKCFKNAFEREPHRCRVVKNLEEVRIHKDGFIHHSTIISNEETGMHTLFINLFYCPVNPSIFSYTYPYLHREKCKTLVFRWYILIILIYLKHQYEIMHLKSMNLPSLNTFFIQMPL